jgi:tRNA-specific 2-thiouridylase
MSAAAPHPRVLVAMSGGVDSSVAAALLVEAGHDVTGVTLRLWGGESDTGCCAVSDVHDARRAADALGIEHLVFGFSDDFERHVVAPYVADHSRGVTPNPCIECNRNLKFDRLWWRAKALGFDAIATGHHAQIVRTPDGPRLARGADVAKDQSYVLWTTPVEVLSGTLLPIGAMTKDEVRARAASLGLRTASKPDSQDVCFITRAAGREAFLRRRIPLHEGVVRDELGNAVGVVPAIELVTVGQRRGLGVDGIGEPRFAVAVDVPGATVTVGARQRLLVESEQLDGVLWAGDGAPAGRVLAQTAAHGTPRPCTVEQLDATSAVVRWEQPAARVAPGQSVVLYDDDDGAGTHVLGGGQVAPP